MIDLWHRKQRTHKAPMFDPKDPEAKTASDDRNRMLDKCAIRHKPVDCNNKKDIQSLLTEYQFFFTNSKSMEVLKFCLHKEAYLKCTKDQSLREDNLLAATKHPNYQWYLNTLNTLLSECVEGHLQFLFPLLLQWVSYEDAVAKNTVDVWISKNNEEKKVKAPNISVPHSVVTTFAQKLQLMFPRHKRKTKKRTETPDERMKDEKVNETLMWEVGYGSIKEALGAWNGYNRWYGSVEGSWQDIREKKGNKPLCNSKKYDNLMKMEMNPIIMQAMLNNQNGDPIFQEASMINEALHGWLKQQQLHKTSMSINTFVMVLDYCFIGYNLIKFEAMLKAKDIIIAKGYNISNSQWERMQKLARKSHIVPLFGQKRNKPLHLTNDCFIEIKQQSWKWASRFNIGQRQIAWTDKCYFHLLVFFAHNDQKWRLSNDTKNDLVKWFRHKFSVDTIVNKCLRIGVDLTA